jgi:cytochrome c-type biogenesis protein CcmH
MPNLMLKSKIIFSALIFSLCAAVLLAVPAAAQQPTPPTDDDVNRVAKQMYCPVCENTPLDVCPTQACAQWRDLIRQKLAEGWSDQQIREYFVQQYGDRVLSEPPARGLNWLVYVLPPLFFLLGVFVVVRVLRSMRGRAPQPAAPSVPPAAPVSQDDYLRRMEEELRRRQ